MTDQLGWWNIVKIILFWTMNSSPTVRFERVRKLLGNKTWLFANCDHMFGILFCRLHFHREYRNRNTYYYKIWSIDRFPQKICLCARNFREKMCPYALTHHFQDKRHQLAVKVVTSPKLDDPLVISVLSKCAIYRVHLIYYDFKFLYVQEMRQHFTHLKKLRLRL